MLLAAATKQVPAEIPPALQIFSFIVLLLIPVGLFVYVQLFRRIEREGPKTRPDLFVLTDVVAVAIVFGLLFVPAVVVRVTEGLKRLSPPAAASAEAAVASETSPVPLPEPPTPGAPAKDAGEKKDGEGKEMTLTRLFGSMVILALPTFGLLAVIRIRGGSLKEIFGLRKVPFFQALVIGLGCSVLAYPIMLGINLIVNSLVHHQEAPQQLIQTFKDATTVEDHALIIAIAVSATVVAPICEEILFRGAFYPVAARALGRGPSALLMALVFALIHDTFAAAPSLMVLALCFTILYEAYGSILVPIFCHAGFNAINLIILKLGLEK